MRESIKVHLGCGARRLPGFVHIDPRADVNPDRIGSAENLPVDTESVELLYWCHGLEHIQRPRVNEVLLELRRVLIPGGILRLSLPDFSALAELYVSGQAGMEQVVGPLHGRQDYPENTHYCSYNSLSLRKVLSEAGFIQVGDYNPQQVNPAWYDDYSYARIDGVLISLNVEARK